MSPTVQRPRVDGDREEQILCATLDLLIEVGYDRLTMDAIAAQAKASKATLYRRWETKANLVIEAVTRSPHAGVDAVPDTGSLRGDLVGFFCGPQGAVSSSSSKMFGAVMSAVMTDDEFARLFRERFIGPKVSAAADIYRRAAERGEVREGLDHEIVGPALPAIVLHRALILGLPIDDDVIARIVDNVILPAVLPQPAKDAR
jgi:AcrR family transcriptional regulator